MSGYLFIESRDAVEVPATQEIHELALKLVRPDRPVTLFLVQNGVLAARDGGVAAKLTALRKAGVEVLADEFSLRERGIVAGRLAGGVESAPIHRVVDLLAEGRKAIWH